MMTFETFSDEAFAAYLAAFTDGEGHLAYPPGGGVRIVLANCVPEVLEGIRNRLGFGVIRSQLQKPHWRRRYLLTIQNAANCEAFLKLAYPYLQIKRATADLMLARCAEWKAAIEGYELRNKLIREAIENGEQQKQIATRFGVSEQTISRLKCGQSWASSKPSNARGLQGKVKHHASWTSAPLRQSASQAKH